MRPRARAPPDRHPGSTTMPSIFRSTPTFSTNERESAMTTDQISDFLNAVDELRAEDDEVRSTAHTSSVSADGWVASEQANAADAQ